MTLYWVAWDSIVVPSFSNINNFLFSYCVSCFSQLMVLQAGRELKVRGGIAHGVGR